MSIVLPISSTICHLKLTNRELEKLSPQQLNQVVASTTSEYIYIDSGDGRFDPMIAAAIRLVTSKGYMVVVGNGSVPLVFSRAHWAMLGGFEEEGGERIFSHFLVKARKLRKFVVVQLG